MSDRTCAMIVSAAKYAFINILAFIALLPLSRLGVIYLEDSVFLYFLIINCTAAIFGKLRRIEDRLKEIEKKEENSKNNA